MIQQAEKMAMAFARSAESRVHVEASDLAGAALLAHVQGRAMRYGIVDELRRLYGRESNPRPLVDQLSESYQGTVEPDYIVPLALKRCGVLMLDCLPERLRRLIMLRYWHGLSQVETGRELGFTVSGGVACCRVSQLEKQACGIIARELRRRGIRSMRDVI